MGKWLTRAENDIFIQNIIFLYARFPNRPTHIFLDFARRTTNPLGFALGKILANFSVLHIICHN